MLSLDALSMWGCVAAVGCMCHTQWVAGRSCPRLPWEASALTIGLRARSASINNPPLETHNTARRRPAAY